MGGDTCLSAALAACTPEQCCKSAALPSLSLRCFPARGDDGASAARDASATSGRGAVSEAGLRGTLFAFRTRLAPLESSIGRLRTGAICMLGATFSCEGRSPTHTGSVLLRAARSLNCARRFAMEAWPVYLVLGVAMLARHAAAAPGPSVRVE